jgi:Tfp pilus assembly protein PilV
MQYTSIKKSACKRSNRGFSSIEALVAMLIMSFGMLALVSMQNTFSVTADAAKLRSEATRLAQQKIDELRAFEQVVAESGKFSFNANVISSTSATQETLTPVSNTTFLRSWTVTPNSTGMYKSINVTVDWTDRQGNQSLSLATVISRSDPSEIGTLGVGPGTTIVRKPKNRNINIPYPAVSIQGGGSAFQPPGSGVVIVFDNTTGNVKGKCTGASGASLPIEGGTVNLAASGCDTDTGYLLSGYVRFCTSNNCGPNQPGDAGATYANATDTTLPLNSSTPLELADTSNQTAGNPTMICYSSRQVTLNNGVNAADTGQANNLVSARFISYACIVRPVDHDSNSNTQERWWGRVTLNPSGWTIGSSNSNYKVCRFSADYDLSGTMSNNEHPLWYRGVTGALDSQNFLVIQGDANCPNDKPTDPVNGDFVNANTVVHQTSGNSATGSELSFTCKTIACSGSNKVSLEPSTLSTDLPTQ